MRSPATPFFEQADLKVFDSLPEDERVTSIHESFVPAVSADSLPRSQPELDEAGRQWMKALREQDIRGWPAHADAPKADAYQGSKPAPVSSCSEIEFESQGHSDCRCLFCARKSDVGAASVAHVLTQHDWESCVNAIGRSVPDRIPTSSSLIVIHGRISKRSIGDTALVFVLPRGVGPTEWSRDEKSRIQIRRRFMQLGQTLAGMQAYDVLRALQLIAISPELPTARLPVNAAVAKRRLGHSSHHLFADQIDQLDLTDLPVRNRDAPDMLNVSRFVEFLTWQCWQRSRTGSLTLPPLRMSQMRQGGMGCNPQPKSLCG